MKPLKGIKILDFTKLLPGPLATNMLADLGADVIKIEKNINADYVRNQLPMLNGISTLYAALNNLKSNLILDWENDEGRAELLNIIRSTDVLIEQFRPGVMKYWNLDYDTLKEINPNLIYISLSGYGQFGPHSDKAGHDLNYLAISGVLDQIRDENGRPVIPGIQIADIAGGAYMLQVACLSAVLERQQSGSGLYIDLAMTDAVVPLLTFPLSQWWGDFDQREMKILSGGLVNYNVYPCSDGKWIALGALEIKFWNSFCDKSLNENWKRQEIFELSIHVFPKIEIEDYFMLKSRDEWVEWAKNFDFCLSPVLEMDELENSPQYQQRRMIAAIDNSIEKGLKYIKPPFF
jgi:alpha-methylacyl-CoA racemase